MKSFARILLAAVLLSSLTASVAQAQRVLLRSVTRFDTVETRTGPNRAFFQHAYVGYAPVVGRSKNSGAELRSFSSAELFAGMRYKFRLSQQAAVGFDVRYVRLNYALVQNAQKVLPNATTHHSENLVIQQAVLEPYMRLNFGRRGNVVGRYLDLTAGAGWVFGTLHTYQDRGGSNRAKRTIVNERGLDYLERWPLTVGARLGSGRLVAVGRYRLTHTFTPSARTFYPELPRVVIGLELDII
ncbi:MULTISPECIES: hypothetical protein [Hymenobacter]|nr:MULTISPECIES: hypothetical protein [Hymenobacter]